MLKKSLKVSLITSLLSFSFNSFAAVCFKVEEERHPDVCYNNEHTENDLDHFSDGSNLDDDIVGIYFTNGSEDDLTIKLCTDDNLGGVCFDVMQNAPLFSNYRDSISSLQVTLRNNGPANGCFWTEENPGVDNNTPFCAEAGHNQVFSGNFNDGVKSYSGYKVDPDGPYRIIHLFDERGFNHRIWSAHSWGRYNTLDGANDRGASFAWYNQ